LEVSDTTYSEVRLCHLDLRVLAKDPSGKPHRMGALKERFLSSLVLGSSSALGDALVGRLRWADPRALKERNILLGEDDQAAFEYVKATREHLVQQFQVAFSYIVELGKKGYRESSYFVAGQLREETDDYGSSSMRATLMKKIMMKRKTKKDRKRGTRLYDCSRSRRLYLITANSIK
jgi:hypothetical protein